LGDLLDKSVARFRLAHPENPLIEDRDQGLPTLTLDAHLFRRAIDNLLDNAGKYSLKGGKVTLRCRAMANGTTVEIQDEGRGIGPSDLPKLFTPFFRADRSRTRATGGVGLGLTLARRIVDAHGGKLEVHSELGQGTTALVQLPLETTAPSSDPPSPS
jgi:signal transduction histidine kinase